MRGSTTRRCAARLRSSPRRRSRPTNRSSRASRRLLLWLGRCSGLEEGCRRAVSSSAGTAGGPGTLPWPAQRSHPGLQGSPSSGPWKLDRGCASCSRAGQQAASPRRAGCQCGRAC
eukprot:15442242-Alexandrium_andersonii.AAC.1